ncbi:MAG TPA: pilus assembly PilX N-terminal domain-containing protein [Gemmatimonadaceae bacterium]|nr:pilus assembly PilX N-terminal domain-containing protein [Gemmatimonadaceae bacterium]
MNAVRSTPVSRVNRDGFVLPTVVFAVAIMSIVVVASLTTSQDERRASRAVRESTLAMYTAEAGLRQTYGNWPVNAVIALNPGDSLDLGWQTLPNNEKYRAVIHRVDFPAGLQEYNVVVQGRRTGLNGGMSTIIGAVGGVPLFTRAVYGGQLVWIQNATLDSWDSSLGPYNALTANMEADVFSNANCTASPALPCGMTLQKTTIGGDAGATGPITLNNSPVVKGTITPNMPAETPYDNLPCPAGGYSPVTPELAAVGYTGNGVLNLASGQTLNLISGKQYFFRSVTMAGTSKLQLPLGTANVNFMVQDSIYMAGGSIANTGHKATDLSFTNCGTPTDPTKTNYWGITGGADAYFSVYAPTKVVYALGNSEFYGAVISNIFYITGSALFHYDEALARAPSPYLRVQKATWGQFPGN